MAWAGDYRAWVTLLAGLLFPLPGPRLQVSTAPSPASAPPEATLRLLTEQFYEGYARKDLAAFLALWSPSSPDLEARRHEVENLFAAQLTLEVQRREVRSVRVDGDKAVVRVVLEMAAVETNTGQPATGRGRMNRTIHWVREGPGWKVWREGAAETDLAAALVAAGADERTALMARDGELVTVDLQRALIAEGDRVLEGGEYARALEAFTLALSVADRLQDRSGAATALRNRAYVHGAMGDGARAARDGEEALKIAEGLGDQALTAWVLNTLGILHYSQRDYDQAQERFARSLALARAAGEKELVPRLLNNLGELHRVRGEYPQALDLCGQGLSLAQQTGDAPRIAYALNCLAIVHGSQGHYSQALDSFLKGLKLAEERGDRAAAARIRDNIGNVYGIQGNDRQALEQYQATLDFARASGDKDAECLALLNIGISQSALGRYDQAIESIEKGLAAAPGDRAMTAHGLVAIGEAQMELGRYDQARECFERSLRLREELGEKSLMAWSLRAMAEVERRRQRYPASLELAQRAIALAEQAGEREQTWQARTTMGRTLLALGRPAEARRALEAAVDAIESSRTLVAGGEEEQQRFFEGRVAPYQQMVALLAAEGLAGEALAYAERAKARVLLDVLRSGKVSVTKAMSTEEQERERALTVALVSLAAAVRDESVSTKPDPARLAGLNERLAKARLEHEAFRTALFASHPELKAQRGEVSPPSPAEAAALVTDAASAILEYVVTEERTYLFVLTKGSPPLQVHTLEIARKDLGRRVSAFRERLGRRSLDVRRPAVQLYELLLGPARKQIAGKTKLVIVSDDVLWDVPFQALEVAGGRYLVEDYAVSYAPSITALRVMASRRKEPAGQLELLAVGNPALDKPAVERLHSIYRGEALGPLPHAEREVRSLAELYGRERSRVYVGADAREERVKAEAGRYRVLHLATHGILNDASPMYSQLVLSPEGGSGKEDGLLEAWEVIDLDLKADLAVLSACETGRGRAGAGEGLIGLSWAFFVAGCPATVASQWKVESASTTELMLAFHRRLRAGASKAGALRAAALKLLRDSRYRHPFYWAGFVIVGDGS
jgi:CHAT domain-containing protein/Tfp pilus assembly protein PilF